MRDKFLNMNVAAEVKRLGLSEARLPVMHPIYYGQCGEDYIVLSILRALAVNESLDLARERYLEIGANHPVSTSSTYLLHTGLGMTGVLVDANPHLISELERARPSDEVLHAAVSADFTGETDFYVSDYSELSSLKEGFITDFPHASAAVAEKVRVKVVAINELFARQFLVKGPLFVSVDVEGMDVDLIEALDLTTMRPFILQVEASKDWGAEGFHRIERALRKQDYVAVALTDVNVIYIDGKRLHSVEVSHSAGMNVTMPSLRVSERTLIALLEKVEILSLDVFDTILARRCVDPVDVFSYMENRHGLPGFREARIKAEGDARRRFRDAGEGETSLEEIYVVLGERMVLPENIAELELHAEMLFLYPIPGIQQLISLAHGLGKRVVAVTDIYLSAAQVGYLLRSKGIFVNRIYSSSDLRDRQVGKYNGKMYGHVFEQECVRPEQVLHLGDNNFSDVVSARCSGALALHTERVFDLISRKSENFPSLLFVGKCGAPKIILGNMARRYISPTGRAASEIERFGYEYAGPLLIGFVKFIIDEARSRGLKNLVLLARDGIIVKRVLDIIKPHGLSWRVMPASRRMTVFPLFSDGGLSSIQSLFEGGPEVETTRAAVLQRLMLDDLLPASEEDDLPLPLSKIIHLMSEPLKAQAEAERVALLEALRPVLDARRAGEHFAWVDVGWALTSISALNRLIGDPAPGFFVGSHKRADPYSGLSGYLFERGNPSNVEASVMSACEIVELIFSDVSQSTAYLVNGPSGVIPRLLQKTQLELVRDGFIADVQKGALDFVRDTVDLFDGLNSEELRSYNRAVFERLCRTPSVDQYALLSQIPHDRLPGKANWASIGDYWKPLEFATPCSMMPVSTEGPKQGEVDLRSFAALGRWRAAVEYAVLKGLAKLSPLLPQRMAARFSRSAHKRRSRMQRPD